MLRLVAPGSGIALGYFSVRIYLQAPTSVPCENYPFVSTLFALNGRIVRLFHFSWTNSERNHMNFFPRYFLGLGIGLLFWLASSSLAGQKPELIVQTGHTDDVISVAFHPNRRILASGGRDYTIKLWEVDTGRELRTFKGHTGSVRSVAFQSDGRLLASGSEDGTIRIWEVETGRQARTITGNNGGITASAFSPDGRLLVGGSEKGMIGVWEVDTGRQVRILMGHDFQVTAVAFQPDGRLLASGSGDGTVRPV